MGFRDFLYDTTAISLGMAGADISVDKYLAMSPDEQKRYLEDLAGRKTKIVSVRDEALSRADVEKVVDRALA